MRDRSHIALVREREESLGRLVGRAVDLAQRVAIDEFRLLRIESRDELLSLALRAGGVAFGGLCIVLAWIALWAAVGVSLEPYLSLPARLGVVGVAQAVLGAALVIRCVRGARQ